MCIVAYMHIYHGDYTTTFAEWSSYLSAEMQSAYFTALALWAQKNWITEEDQGLYIMKQHSTAEIKIWRPLGI